MPSTLIRRGPVSILDSDLYKFTMQQAVLELYPNAEATIQFFDRRLQKLGWLAPILWKQIEEHMSKLALEDHEAMLINLVGHIDPSDLSGLAEGLDLDLPEIDSVTDNYISKDKAGYGLTEGDCNSKR